jgi:aryl-alcohol dehydrogenase-like predicted oxidoreductase
MTKLGGRDLGALALGTAKFAFGNGSFEQSVDTIRAAVECGVALVDTALAYTRSGVRSYAESVVGAAIRRFGRDAIVVATKGGHWREGDDFPVDDRAATLRRHCELSRRELGVEVIDLYQIHHPDPSVPIEESVSALEELRRTGEIRHIGLSNVDITLVERARAVAPIAAIQNRLSIATRADLPMAQYCAREGLLYLAYMPFDGSRARAGSAVEEVADRRGVSVHRVMLAWLHEQADSIVPVVGASRPETIRDSAAPFSLDAGEKAELDHSTGAGYPCARPETDRFGAQRR